MNKKEAILAAKMLDEFSEMLGGQCCNDWEFPNDWNLLEKTSFVKEFHDYNGDPEEFDINNISLPDFCVANFLSHKLKELTK